MPSLVPALRTCFCFHQEAASLTTVLQGQVVRQGHWCYSFQSDSLHFIQMLMASAVQEEPGLTL
jgi:hypothetical protein